MKKWRLNSVDLAELLDEIKPTNVTRKEIGTMSKAGIKARVTRQDWSTICNKCHLSGCLGGTMWDLPRSFDAFLQIQSCLKLTRKQTAGETSFLCGFLLQTQFLLTGLECTLSSYCPVQHTTHTRARRATDERAYLGHSPFLLGWNTCL